MIRLFPKHTCYVEVFSGAAWVLFAKEPSKVEVLNDIDGELINLYEVMRRHPEELAQAFLWLPMSRELFNKFKRGLGRRMSRLERAARFLYLIHYSFSKKTRHFGTGTTAGIRGYQVTALRERLLEARDRLEQVVIENLPFEECVRRYDRPHTLFYLDPPYLDRAQYRFEFVEKDHLALAKLLGDIRGRFVLSYNDHPLIRQLYKGLVVTRVSVRYTAARKISARRTVTELLIRNFK